MKKILTLTVVAVLALSMMVLSSCESSEFGIVASSDKSMVVNAENADEDCTSMVGILSVEDGEQIEIKADLSEGSIRVEIFEGDIELSDEELPDFDGKAVITADLKTTESSTGTVPAGVYTLKATSLEKATGTVTVDVTPAP